MKKFNLFIVFISLMVVIFFTLFVNAQPPGPSFSASYDFYPYSQLKDPDTEPVNGVRNFQQDLEIRVATLKLKASYPMPLSQTTFLMHELSYDRFDMDYVKWNEIQGGRQIPHGHAIKYNLMIMRTLSEKWSFLVFITPGLASDFRSKLSKDDITIEAALIYIYQFSKKFSLGAGLAYSRQFGEPFPLPVIALEWNNGSDLKASAILPASLELWYMMSQRFELGLVLSGDGNEYHGDPDGYGGDNPKLKYSVFTLGPSLKYKLSKTFSLHVDGGYVLGRRFEFTNEINGTDVEDIFDLENAAYVRIGFEIGG